MSAIDEVSSLPLSPLDRPSRIDPAGSGSSFGDALGNAISSGIANVDQLQQNADAQSTALAEGSGNLHETSIALSKAEVGMHFMTQVRNKVVAAYEDIMKMSI